VCSPCGVGGCGPDPGGLCLCPCRALGLSGGAAVALAKDLDYTQKACMWGDLDPAYLFKRLGPCMIKVNTGVEF